MKMQELQYFSTLATLCVVLAFLIRHLTSSWTTRRYPRRLSAVFATVASLWLIEVSACSGIAYENWIDHPNVSLQDWLVPKLWLYYALPDLTTPALIIFFLALVLTTFPLRRKLGPIWSKVSAFIAVPAVLLSSLLLFVIGCDQACEVRSPVVWSPDHQFFVRTEELDGGAMDSFHTSVTLRSSNRLHAWTVLTSEQAPSDIRIEWKDASHLRLGYRATADRLDPEYSCVNGGPVSVLCKPY
jgi:hypothetical protein